MQRLSPPPTPSQQAPSSIPGSPTGPKSTLELVGASAFGGGTGGASRATAEDTAPGAAADRPSLLAFDWHPDSNGPPTTVALTFAAHENGTLVSVVETGYLDTPGGLAEMVDTASGWGEALTALKVYIDHGIRLFPV